MGMVSGPDKVKNSVPNVAVVRPTVIRHTRDILKPDCGQPGLLPGVLQNADRLAVEEAAKIAAEEEATKIAAKEEAARLAAEGAAQQAAEGLRLEREATAAWLAHEAAKQEAEAIRLEEEACVKTR